MTVNTPPPLKFPDEVDFFNLPNPSSRTMALGSTQPLTEMSTRNLPGGKGRPARQADNLTTVSRLSRKTWKHRRLTNLWASAASCRDSFTFYISHINKKAQTPQLLWVTLHWTAAFWFQQGRRIFLRQDI
jgi:hypothetical protein